MSILFILLEKKVTEGTDLQPFIVQTDVLTLSFAFFVKREYEKIRDMAYCNLFLI